MNIFSYEFNIFGNDLSELIVYKMLDRSKDNYGFAFDADAALIERFAVSMGIKNKGILLKIKNRIYQVMEESRLLDEYSSDWGF